MTEFLQIMGAIILAGIGATIYFFRKGGIYNPVIQDIPDFTDVDYLPEPPVVAPKQPVQPVIPESTPTLPPTPSQSLYSLAYENIGNHLSLDPSVPVSLGCAQAISWLFLEMGYGIRKDGISTVARLTTWMLKQGFVEEKKYGVGYVITGRNATTAHIGICGKDWIMSNTSSTNAKKGLVAGQFQANYRRAAWGRTYPQTRFFRPV